MYILSISILFSNYILGAFATTDILRLLKGSSLPVWEGACFCPICNKKLSLIEQLPILSYLFQKGRCKHCKTKIPFENFLFEIAFFLLFGAITLLSRFSFSGFFLTVFSYEAMKVFFILRFGKRENDFLKNLLFSLFQNLILFGLISFFYLLKNSEKLL